MQISSPRSPGITQVTSAGVAADATSASGRGGRRAARPPRQARAISARRCGHRAVELDVLREDLRGQVVVPGPDQLLGLLPQLHRRGPQPDGAGGTPLAVEHPVERLLGHRHRVAAVAVGQHHHAVAGVRVPGHVQQESGQPAAVRHDGAAVEILDDRRGPARIRRRRSSSCPSAAGADRRQDQRVQSLHLAAGRPAQRRVGGRRSPAGGRKADPSQVTQTARSRTVLWMPPAAANASDVAGGYPTHCRRGSANSRWPADSAPVPDCRRCRPTGRGVVVEPGLGHAQGTDDLLGDPVLDPLADRLAHRQPASV